MGRRRAFVRRARPVLLLRRARIGAPRLSGPPQRSRLYSLRLRRRPATARLTRATPCGRVVAAPRVAHSEGGRRRTACLPSAAGSEIRRQRCEQAWMHSNPASWR